MKYTQEQIDKLKNDPVVQLLSIVTGTPIDKMVSEIEVKKVEQCEKPEAEVSDDDTDAIYPLTKEDVSVIVNAIKNVHMAMDAFYTLDIDIWNSTLGDAVSDLITLLSSYLSIEDGLIDIDGDTWVNESVETLTDEVLKYYE